MRPTPKPKGEGAGDDGPEPATAAERATAVGYGANGSANDETECNAAAVNHDGVLRNQVGAATAAPTSQLGLFAGGDGAIGRVAPVAPRARVELGVVAGHVHGKNIVGGGDP